MASHIYKIAVFVLAICSTICMPGHAQLTLTIPNSTGVYTNPVSITLGPGFSSTDFHAYIAEGVPLGSKPSYHKNFIQTNTYLKPFSTAPASPTVDDVMQEIAYVDGFGRPLQTVQAKGSVSYKDVVAFFTYDAHGREDRQYLSYSTAVGAGGAYKPNAVADQAAFYNNPPAGLVKIATLAGVTPSYSQTNFEPSPLSRPVETGFPGKYWRPSGVRDSLGRTALQEYKLTNDLIVITQLANTRAVTKFTVSMVNGVPNLSRSGLYPANELYVTVQKDENWLPADGRAGTQEEYTDKEGKVILKRRFNKTTAGALEMLSTYYVYDQRGNLIFVLPPATNPDGSAVPAATSLKAYAYTYTYDQWDRLAERILPGKDVEYLVYNGNDQVVATQDGNQRLLKQWFVYKYDGLGRPVLSGIWNNGNTAIGRAALQSLVDGLSVAGLYETRVTTGIGYSNQAWPTTSMTDTLNIAYYDNYNIPGLPAAYNKSTSFSKKTDGLPTAGRIRVLDGGSTAKVMLWNVQYYDDDGNLVKQFSQHFKGGAASLSTGNYDEVSQSYTFQRQPLRTERKHYVKENASAPAVTVTGSGEYDHGGRLMKVFHQVNAQPQILLAQYEYNEIGQLIKKKLHSSNNTSFAETISYQYNSRGWMTSASSASFSQTLKYQNGSQPLYNGMISEQQWTRETSTETDRVQYSYDKLYRLRQGVADKGKQELMTYDPMGNILSLKRDAAAATTYTYSDGRLKRLSGTGMTDYLYDKNGNTVHDGRVNTDIQHNILDQPLKITGSKTINYSYDAGGRKLRTVDGTLGQSRDYIDGIEWVDNSLEQISTPEGRLIKSGSTFSYEYFLTDHLGNTRAVFKLSSTGARQAAQKVDYYPFGLSYQTVVASPKNNYLYNGKELQEGLDQYDYHARFYDPVIGRWAGMDPMASAYDDSSPYAYVGNSPLNYMDPTGMVWQDWIKPLDGSSYFWDATINSAADFANSVYASLGGFSYAGKSGYELNGDTGDWYYLDERGGKSRARMMLPEVAINAQGGRVAAGRYYGGDGSGSFGDRFMYRLDQVNQYLPTTHFLNSITYGFSGKDIMGNNMSFGSAMLGAASVLPIGKIGGATFRGIESVAAKGGTKLLPEAFSRFSRFEHHFAKHAGEWGAITKDAYYKRSLSLLEGSVGGGIEGFTNSAGYTFRMNMRTGEFGIMRPNGIVETFFRRLKDPAAYWAEQVAKYGK